MDACKIHLGAWLNSCAPAVVLNSWLNSCAPWMHVRSIPRLGSTVVPFIKGRTCLCLRSPATPWAGFTCAAPCLRPAMSGWCAATGVTAGAAAFREPGASCSAALDGQCTGEPRSGGSLGKNAHVLMHWLQKGQWFVLGERLGARPHRPGNMHRRGTLQATRADSDHPECKHTSWL